MKRVISVTVAFSKVVNKIANLPLLMGHRLHLIFFDFIHYTGEHGPKVQREGVNSSFRG